MFVFRLILSLLVLHIFNEPGVAEVLSIEKITLARFKVQNNSILRVPKSMPDWTQINRHNLTVDDHGHIYVLNLSNNEILVFKDSDVITRKILLPQRKSSPEEIGQLEVSGNGERFFDGEFIFNKDGKIVKKLSETERYIPFPDVRRCNGTYINLQAPYYYDENFRLIGGLGDNKERLSRLYSLSHADSKGDYYAIRKRSLIKYTRDDKKLWEKVFDSSFSILGIDGTDYLYLTGILKKGDPSSLYKLDSKGNILAKASIPDPFPFITPEEKEEWETISSEEFLSFFKLACNGDVYLIYQLGELPKLTFQRWLKGGEYFIYKFETKK